MLNLFYLQGTHLQAVLSTVNNQPLPKPAGATHILIQAQIQNIRYRMDGLAATTTQGFQLAAAAEPRLICVQAGALDVCAEVAGAVIDYQWLIRQGS